MNDHARYASPDYEYGHFHKNKADPERCRWEVSTSMGRSYHYSQCQRKVKVDGLWCTIHSPAYMQQKDDARKAKWKRESDADSYRWKMKAFEKTALKALREIAGGTLNDPVGYARLTLEDEPRKKCVGK